MKINSKKYPKKGCERPSELFLKTTLKMTRKSIKYKELRGGSILCTVMKPFVLILRLLINLNFNQPNLWIPKARHTDLAVYS